jgi:HD-GYP domain-containing protein (c-di-GMP phosphodiesterase class II)
MSTRLARLTMGAAGQAAVRRSLLRCMELSGLTCAAAFRLSTRRPVLEVHTGFPDPWSLEDFFGDPELLLDSLATSPGRVCRLRGRDGDARAETVQGRAALAVVVLVRIGRPRAPEGVVVLGAPLAAPRERAGRLGHTQRVSRYAQLLADAAGLGTARSTLIGLASALHDVGKLELPDSLLSQPGPLSPAQREEIERHAERGHAILAGQGTPFGDLAAMIAFTHHERWDGGGYPRGLRGGAIPLEGRIAAIADVFDALSSDRPYRRAMSPDDALALMRAGSGAHFDPILLELFVQLLGRSAPASGPGRSEPDRLRPALAAACP